MSHNEFPIVCDRCLGCDQSSSTSSSSSSQPPQIRMTKRTNGAECRYCQRVFTPFYWKKGALSMRTEICGVCATIRHLCQSCLLDMDLFVPQYVRDSAAMNENVAFQMIRDTTPTPTTAPHKKHPKHAQQQQQRSGVYRTDARQLLASQQSQQKLYQQSQVTTTFLAEQAEKMLTEGGLNSHLLLDQIAPSTSQLSNMLFSPPQQQQIHQQNKNFTKKREHDQQKHHHHRHQHQHRSQQHQHRSRTHTTPYDRNRTSRTSGGSSDSNGSGNGGRMVDRATMERRQMIEFLKNPQRYLVLPPGVTPLLSTTENDNVTSNSENNSENKDNSNKSNNDGNDQLPPVYPSMVSLPALL